MPVTVMDVGPMSMRVLRFRMLVRVAVGSIGDPAGVGVIVVKVVVDVGMHVRQRQVPMGMGVLFACDEEDSGGH